MDSSQTSHDLARPRRSVASYRLFPIVEPTPPTSPVTLQRNTLSLSRASAGSSRRRSSSLDHATTFSGHRKGSLPELRPLHNYNSNGSARDGDHGSRPPSRRALKSASDVRAQGDENAHGRSNSAPGESSESNGKMANDVVQNHVHQPVAQHSSAHQNQNLLQRQRHKAKPKPNLRIDVAKNESHESQPPPPPPKSPRHWKAEKSPKRDSHSPLSPTTLSTYLDPPQTSHHQPKTALQLPTLPRLSRPRTAAEQSPKMRDAASTTLQAPASKFTAFPAMSRANTASDLVPSSSTRTSSLPPNTSLINLRQNNVSTVNISRPLASPAFAPSVFANDPRPSSRDQTCNDNVPSTPKHDHRPANANQERSPAPSIADVIRQHAASQSQAGGPSRSKDTARELEDPEAAESTARRSPNAALAAVAAARARVLALQSADSTAAAPQGIESPLASPRIMTYGVSPGSETGSISRSLITEVLSRRPSATSQIDPVETLKSISEQCEALNEKYATLRVERQKVSASIIAHLKDQKPGPEHCNMLLDEQLSLASISSSMDICIAKLKSLECRREDAIAALIAQTTQSRTSPADNIAAMIASMAISRKASLAPSADSGSRFMPTGRSTPDISVDGFSANRSTCSSFPRTVSYTSEADSYDYRLSGHSGKPSSGSDLAQRSEAADGHSSDHSLKIGESPLAKRRTPLHEPSEALEQPKETTDSLNEQPTGLVSPLSRESFTDQMSQMDSISRPSSSDTSITDEGIRVHGAKAAKILGMLSEGGQKSPLIRLPHEFANARSQQQRESEVEFELYSSSYRPRVRAADAPFKDLEAPLESPLSRNDDLDSPCLQDLDVQLGNFPKPAPVPPKDNSRSLPPPPSMPPPPPPKYSTTHSEQHQMRKRCPDSPLNFQQQNCSVESNTKRPLSQKSAHTIQVYLDQDQDDLLELYKLRSAATAVS